MVQVVERKPAAALPLEALACRRVWSAATAKGSKAAEFIAVGPSSWLTSKRCVASPKRSVALRNPSSVASAFDPSPKSALKGVFLNLRRAARLKVSRRISERLASGSPRGSEREVVKVSPRRAPLS